MKKFFALGLALVLALTLAGCESAPANRVAGKTYVYEQDGFGGDFTITINNDGTYQYYEGLFSSYFGSGFWQLDGDVLTLSDDAEIGYGLVNYFRADGNALVFQEENSSNFIYVTVSDGERFLETEQTGRGQP